MCYLLFWCKMLNISALIALFISIKSSSISWFAIDLCSLASWISCLSSCVLKKGNEWMNEFLEQLVRDLTNAYSRSQKLFGERISPGPTNQRSFPSLPCCWGTNAMKATTLEPSGLSMLCLSPYQRVFYALASWCPRKDKGLSLNAAAL